MALRTALWTLGLCLVTSGVWAQQSDEPDAGPGAVEADVGTPAAGDEGESAAEEGLADDQPGATEERPAEDEPGAAEEEQTAEGDGDGEGEPATGEELTNGEPVDDEGELDSDEPIEGGASAEELIEAVEEEVIPGVVPRAELGRQIEEAFVTLQQLTPILRRQAPTLEIRRATPNFVGYVERLGRDPALEHLDRLHAAPLRDLEHEWERARLRLAGWQETLEARTAALTETRLETGELGGLWQRTRAAYEEELVASQLERIDELLHRIGRVLRRVDRRLEEVLALQSELSDQGIAIARQASRIDAAEQRLRDRRQRRDHKPLWRGWGRLDGDVDAPSFDVIFSEHVTATNAFLYTEKKSLFAHAFFFLLLLGFFGWLRTQAPVRETPGPALSPRRALRARPGSAALLLTFLLAPILYAYVPVALVGISLLIMVPAIVRLSVFMLPAAHRSIAALLVLAALSVPLSLGFVPDVVRRFYTLALQLVSLRFAYSLWAHAPAFSKRRAHQRLFGFLRLCALPLALATYFLFAGYTERAELWTTGTLWVFEQALGLFLGVQIIAAVVQRLLRRRGARVFYTVRDHRRRFFAYFRMILRWVAVLTLVVLALTSFDLLDPTVASSREAFGRTFTFGSIELSFGSVLAFFAMLVGTFVVMRIVHVLLEYELLPRFNLEQGISSAISLTASYLLVAIGVVLAFGVAGVGPERLALLGGALGVGIGFGLQNVVSNFVSGLILVAERPIKVGDVIEVEGDLVGTVQRIGIRSSTVHSLDGADVIVPNSDLVSGKLINWTLKDAKRRIDLVVGAAYRHDPKEVMAILRRVVGRQAGVLYDPPPEVLCTSFADSAIEYTIRAWASGYLEAIEAKSALAASVHAAFAEADIEIPFPQQDLRILEAPSDATE